VLVNCDWRPRSGTLPGCGGGRRPAAARSASAPSTSGIRRGGGLRRPDHRDSAVSA